MSHNSGFLVRWSVGAMVCWCDGLLVRWSVGPMVFLVRWSVGAVVCWCDGLLVRCIKLECFIGKRTTLSHMYDSQLLSTSGWMVSSIFLRFHVTGSFHSRLNEVVCVISKSAWNTWMSASHSRKTPKNIYLRSWKCGES